MLFLLFRNRRRNGHSGTSAFLSDGEQMMNSTRYEFFSISGSDSSTEALLEGGTRGGGNEPENGTHESAVASTSGNVETDAKKKERQTKNRETERKWEEVRLKKAAEKSKDERLQEFTQSMQSSHEKLSKTSPQSFQMYERRSFSAAPILKTVREKTSENDTDSDNNIDAITKQPMSTSAACGIDNIC